MLAIIFLALACLFNAFCILNLNNKINTFEAYNDVEELYETVSSHWAAEQREHAMIWEVLEELRNGEEDGDGTTEM